MSVIISGIVHWLPEASAQSAFVILGILLLRALAGGRVAPAWWRWLWCLALLRLFAPMFVLPPNPVCLQNIPAVEQSAAALVPSATVENFNRPLTLTPPLTVSQSPADEPAPDLTVSVAKPFPWVTVLFSVWLTGAVLGWTLLAVTHWRFYKRLRRRPADADVEKIWRDCCRRFGVKHPPALCRADAVTSPALVGLFAPALLLPEKMPNNFTVSDWENIFAHELAHYRRRDHWLNAAWLLALTVHWFNPLVWLGYRQLRIDRELAADEWALRRLAADRQRDYGSTLFKLATVSVSGPATLMVGILENHAQLKQRLRRIVNFTPRTALATVSGLLIVSVAAVFVVGKKTERAHPEYYWELTPQETLLAAAANGDTLMLKRALSDGATVNGVVNNRTALILAARQGQADTVALLLRRGADANLAPHPNSSPLLTARHAGHADIAALLLKAGAISPPELDATLGGDLAALKNFAAQPKPEVGRLKLLAQIAAVNGPADACALLIGEVRKNSGEGRWDPGRDILPAVIASGRRDTLQVLIDSGQDVAGQGVVNLSAAIDRRPDMREWLAERGVTAPAYDNNERLNEAAFHDNVPEMARLLKLGADVNYHGENDWTPLTRAGSKSLVQSVKFLLDHGADPNATHYRRHTAMSMSNSVKVADLLYAAGAEVKPEFLDYASTFGFTDMIKWYLAHGVDPNQPMPGRSEPNYLFNASNAELVKIYTAAGADPNARDEYGNTPLMRARNAAVVDALVAAGADIHAKNKGNENVIEANYFSRPSQSAEVLQALVRHGAKFDAKGDDGSFLMIRAAISNNVGLAKFLLDAGTDPNTPGRSNKESNYRNKPLAMCAVDDSYEVAKLLLERGAVVDGEQLNALYNSKSRMVKLFWEHGAREISELSYAVSQRATVGELQKLIDRGEPVNPKNANGMGYGTPLYIAAQFGNLDAVKFLLDHGADVQPAVVEAAAREGRDEILELLLQRGVKVTVHDISVTASNSNPDREQRSKEHFERCAKILLDAGALKNARPKDIGSALQFAIFTRYPGGNLTILKMLLDAGCDPNSPVEFSDGKKVWFSTPSVLEHCREKYQEYLSTKGQEYYAEQLKPSLDLLEAYAKTKARNNR